jgi:hypothetical protein
MSRYAKQTIITIFFLAQLVAVWALNREPRDEKYEGADKAVEKYGFYLKDVAKPSGIDFKHESPRDLDPQLKHILPLIASMGAAVSIVDFDKDGWPDIYVVTSREGGKNRLYRNLGNGKFEEVAEKVGLADLNVPGTGVCMGAVWGDFDNDGFEDVLVYKWGRPELYRNDGGKRFVRVTEKAGLPKWLNANAAIWVDYDRDGKLDLLVAGYWRDDVNLWDLKGDSRIMPESFEFAKNGGRKYLLRNKGDGTFEDVTEQVGITSTRWTLGVAAADLCGTGYPDIILANDYGVSEFLCNKEGKRFDEVGGKGEVGIGQTPKSGMNASFGDLFNRGQFSIYVSNITDPGNLVQGNNLWVPGKKKPGEPPTYRNQADDHGVSRGGWSWAAQIGDLNNDGYQEIFLTNGFISANPKEDYWFDYGKITGAHKDIIKDAKNWPAMRGRSLAGFQKKCVWWNRGGELTDVAQQVGVSETFDGRAVAMADLWNRGVLDVIVAHQDGPLLVYKNTVKPGRDWVQFELEGKKSNRSAIGALVRVSWTMAGTRRVQEQLQVVSGGNAYASQNMRRLHFGLGEGATIKKVEIQWPDGTTNQQTLTGLKTGLVHKIVEPVP